MRKLLPLLVVLLAGAAVFYYVTHQRVTSIVLTGLVTTDDIVVAPQIAGQLGQLLVKEGDLVTRGQLVGVITPDELRADVQYYDYSAQGIGSQVAESQAAV